MAFRPDGTRLSSASTDGTLKVWDLTLDPETDAETADVPAGEPTFELEALAGDSGVEVGLLLQQVDRDLVRNENLTGYCLMIQAKWLAEYRAGRMEQSVEWLRKADSWLRAEGEFADANKVVNFCFLSMAYRQLNRAEEAKAA